MAAVLTFLYGLCKKNFGHKCFKDWQFELELRYTGKVTGLYLLIIFSPCTTGSDYSVPYECEYDSICAVSFKIKVEVRKWHFINQI